MSNAVVKKIVYKVDIRFVSPVSVSSGIEGMTDKDILRDFDGIPFISGSSIAGALRSYVQEKNIVFGFSEGNQGQMSSVFISDLTFNGETIHSIRDSVALDENKITITGAKFDFEVLEAETTKGTFFIELTIREKDNEELLKDTVNQMLVGLRDKEIRLGSKKSRGYGIVSLLDVGRKVYIKENYLEYALAYDKKNWTSSDSILSEIKLLESKSNWIHIEVPLTLQGGISIRKYTVKKGEPDFEHLTDHGLPVIPGTSFMGAIRHRTKEILSMLHEEELPCSVMDDIFGYVKGNTAHISPIFINEAVIKNSHDLVMTRNAISRFESSAKEGALYTERTYVGGNTTLHLAVYSEQPKWMIGILLLAIKDLQNGYLAIGGETSIGRGLFKGNVIRINGEEGKENEYISKAIDRKMGGE